MDQTNEGGSRPPNDDRRRAQAEAAITPPSEVPLVQGGWLRSAVVLLPPNGMKACLEKRPRARPRRDAEDGGESFLSVVAPRGG